MSWRKVPKNIRNLPEIVVTEGENSVYRVGEVEIDLQRACLRRAGEEIHVRAQSFQVLSYLVQNHTRLVTRAELLQNVWSGASVTDDVLTQSIGDLRRLLGDDPRDPVYIKTVPKLGFRFIANVEEVRPAITTTTTEVEVETTTEVNVEIRESRYLPWATAAIIAAAALLTFAWSRRDSIPAPPADKTPIAVMFFEDRSGRPDLYWLREGLADMLITNLSRSPKLAPLPRDHIRRLLDRTGGPNGNIPLDQALDAARRGNARQMILGAFAVRGSGLRLDTQIYEVSSGRLVTGESLTTDSLGDLLAKFDTLTLRLALALQAPLPGGARASRLAEARTDNLEAFRAYSLGVERAESFHSAEALNLFQKAVQLDPQFAMAHARLGYTHSVSAGVSGLGKPHLERAFALSKTLTERDRLYVAAWYSIACEDYNEAIQVYRRILDEFPAEIGAYASLGRILRGEQRHSEALSVLLKGRSIDPEWGDIENVLSGVYFELGQPEQAIASGRRYVALARSEPNAHDTLGLVYQRAGRYAEALESYQHALRLKENFEPAFYHRANVYYELGRYREALDAYRRYERMTSVAQQRGRARLATAWILWSKRDLRNAARELADWPAGAMPPIIKPVIEAELRGPTYSGGVVTPATTIGLNARGKRLTSRAVHYFAGVANLRSGHTEQALNNFRNALSALPLYWEKSDLEDCLADAYLELKRWDEAIAEYRRVLAINPNRALARYHLGIAYANRGSHSAARQEFERFLDIWKSADEDLAELIDAKQRVGTLQARR